MPKEVYSICFMCTVRCPIRVLVENDDVKWIEGNPHVAGIEGALCAKGSAGLALLHDHERPQHPMIRTGPRGAGEWKKATWNEALDYVGDRLKEIIKEHGGQSVVFGERTNLNTHISKTFMKAVGSPNHFTHDALCKGSLNTALGASRALPTPRWGWITPTPAISSCMAATSSSPWRSRPSITC